MSSVRWSRWLTVHGPAGRKKDLLGTRATPSRMTAATTDNLAAPAADPSARFVLTDDAPYLRNLAALWVIDPALAARVAPSPGRRQVGVVNILGLHLRAADKFVRLAREYRADVRVSRDGRKVSGKSILELATLAAGYGTRLELEADGPDAEAALDALTGLIERGFDEQPQ